MYGLTCHDSRFSKFVCIYYTINVSFQQINRPTGTHDKIKPWFGVRHSKYGLKAEFSAIEALKCIIAVTNATEFPTYLYLENIFGGTDERSRKQLKIKILRMNILPPKNGIS